MSAETAHNLGYLESLFASYGRDSQSVSEEWRNYFENGGKSGNFPVTIAANRKTTGRSFSDRLNELIRNHRLSGHLMAQVNPLKIERPIPPELELDFYGFGKNELDSFTNSATLPYDSPLSVREIFQRLRNTYCGPVGVQFMHIEDYATRQWLQRRMEVSQNRAQLSHDEQCRILTRLFDAVIFEEFLRKKFIGAKTFSLEGSETLLPLLDLLIEKAGQQGVRDIVLGMGHRGRLNVLTHIAGKDPGEIFREFADAEPALWLGRGDVKYHLGHSHDLKTTDGHAVHVSLCFNPSHVEFVNPLVLGRVRARQDRTGDRDRRQVLGVLIHGDAAFAGEGIVQEALNLSKLPGYFVGGAFHIILNNQIGFTTSPGEGRSTMYATDVARMLQAPIFHVNGECAEAVAHVVRLALDFRCEFQSDVFVDLLCYRRWGHNETDNPSFTQPVLYQAIENRASVCETCLKDLRQRDGITATEAEEIGQARRMKLEQELATAKQPQPTLQPAFRGVWADYSGGAEPEQEPDTEVDPERLAALLHQLTKVPEGFRLHPKLERGLQQRREMAEGKHALDWSTAEALALATLATEGVRIRLTGQDTGRGTFSQRHAIFYDQQNGDPHIPLQHLAPDQAAVEIHNSPLSEAGALGFEYGFSLDCPDGLVVWEAQFGDFVNAAQVILDQFISSAEDKWRRLSGLVLLLPHGFEGLGPEHSSARLERFLTLAAEDNLQIVQPTTPAQYFHVLRRQAKRPWRKPLVIFTPKSLLRHPQAVSTLGDFAQGRFQRILQDRTVQENAERVLLCTGKLYYELAAHRDEHHRDKVGIIRLEHLYPLRNDRFEQALHPYPENMPVFWVQEEPANMGAWRYLHERFGTKLCGRFPLALVSRSESASPATGSHSAHRVEQAQLVARAFGDPETMSGDAVTVTTASAKSGDSLQEPMAFAVP
jgi:2-oxoglutarate dehydrogenase E1 component